MAFSLKNRDGWILLACSLVLSAAAAFEARGPALALVILFCLGYGAWVVGTRLAGRLPGGLAFFAGVLGLISLQTILLTVWYYASGLITLTSGSAALASCLFLCACVAFLVGRHTDEQETTDEPADATGWRAMTWMAALGCMSLVASAFLLRSAWLHGTADAIRTPWPLLPAGSLAACVLLFLAAVLAVWRGLPRWFVAAAVSLACGSVFLLAPLLYRNGFGFDGFLHRASEQVMLTTGTLQPKPLYYIGQYVFVTWICQTFDLPLRGVDILLVPLLAALLPLGFLLDSRDRRGSAWRVVTLLLFLPLSAFVATTPQSLSYLLGLFAVALAVSEAHASLSFLTAGWAVAVHPLAGLPFFGATLVLAWQRFLVSRQKRPLWSVITWLLVAGSGASVPLAFFVNSLRSSAAVTWNLSALIDPQTYAQALTSALTFPRSHAALWADLCSLLAVALPFLTFAFAVVGAWRNRDRRPAWILLIALGAGMVASGFFLKTGGDFTFLIDYERGNYAGRLFIVASLFFLLPAMDGLGSLIRRTLQGGRMQAATLLVLLAVWSGAQITQALPRHDAAEVSRGWSVGRADQETVRLINRDAENQPYTVLANQSVSAAAVEAFGFKRYVGDVFYYPIPTGGPLYQIFLQTEYGHPARDAIRQAATLGQSQRVYVALNDYWWDAERVGEELGAIADRTFVVQDGKVRVYRFDF